jgi:hypothetical protein
MSADARRRLLLGGVLMSIDAETCARKDLAGGTGSFIAIWIAPVIAAAALSLPVFPAWAPDAAWAMAFAWMGAACLLNARRCGRLHCYFSGPILLLGAASIAGIGFAGLDLGPAALPLTVVVTLTLAALTYALELIWGRYVRSK